MDRIDRVMDSFAFYIVAERLKHIGRLNTLLDTSRPETVAEHCWHVSLLALLLGAYAPPDIDHVRVRVMCTTRCGDRFAGRHAVGPYKRPPV